MFVKPRFYCVRQAAADPIPELASKYNPTTAVFAEAKEAAPQPDAAKAASESAGTGASGLLAVFAEAKVTEKTNVLASLLGDTDASADMVLEALAARN